MAGPHRSQVWLTQSLLDRTQFAHAAPVFPHTPFVSPGWHSPFALQQPAGQVMLSQDLHCFPRQMRW